MFEIDILEYIFSISNWTTGPEKLSSASWRQGNRSAGGMIVPADATKWAELSQLYNSTGNRKYLDHGVTGTG